MTAAERLALRQRALTLAGLALLVVLAWGWLIAGAGMAMSAPMAGTQSDRGLLAVTMWAVMMVAMMLPSAAPMILLFGRASRHRREPSYIPPTAAFVVGYLMCWGGFSVMAALSQLALIDRAMADPMMLSLHKRGAVAAVLAVAGLYQLSPFKDRCLSQCRAPAQFLARHYRPGAAGALRLGLIHGAYCVGCCWLLMALLFVGGVMNLAWVAALTLLVAAEKMFGRWVARLSGALLVLAGLALLLR
ncbi:MAG: DUF2182 domain-containing protein [Sphingomicrobium sp.]